MSGLEGFTGGSGIQLTLGPSGHLPRSAPGLLQLPTGAKISLEQCAAAGVGSSAGCCGSSLRHEELDMNVSSCSGTALQGPLLLHNPQEAAAVLPKKPQ